MCICETHSEVDLAIPGREVECEYVFKSTLQSVRYCGETPKLLFSISTVFRLQPIFNKLCIYLSICYCFQSADKVYICNASLPLPYFHLSLLH